MTTKYFIHAFCQDSNSTTICGGFDSEDEAMAFAELFLDAFTNYTISDSDSVTKYEPHPDQLKALYEAWSPTEGWK